MLLIIVRLTRLPVCRSRRDLGATRSGRADIFPMLARGLFRLRPLSHGDERERRLEVGRAFQVKALLSLGTAVRDSATER